jgi:hypothetical protein
MNSELRRVNCERAWMLDFIPATIKKNQEVLGYGE